MALLTNYGAYTGVRNLLFQKPWLALFSCDQRFKIRSFALFLTNWLIYQTSFTKLLLKKFKKEGIGKIIKILRF